jgi:hypothetical protein
MDSEKCDKDAGREITHKDGLELTSTKRLDDTRAD